MKCTWRRLAKQLCQPLICFSPSYQVKFPKACESLKKDKEVLFTFYDFPAQHWPHLRTTNPIESTFATVRLRTHRTKGSGSRIATLTMVFKLGLEARKALAPAPGFRTDPKGCYWCPIRRRRGTNRTSRLTSQFS